MRYAFIHTHKPGLDDGSFRAFDTMADYRDWCERTLPSWLGDRRVEYRQALEIRANTRREILDCLLTFK